MQQTSASQPCLPAALFCGFMLQEQVRADWLCATFSCYVLTGDVCSDINMWCCCVDSSLSTHPVARDGCAVLRGVAGWLPGCGSSGCCSQCYLPCSVLVAHPISDVHAAIHTSNSGKQHPSSHQASPPAHTLLAWPHMWLATVADNRV